MPPPPLRVPPRPRRRYAPRLALGGLLLLAILVVAAFGLREPRVGGRTMAEWLDSLGSTSSADLRATLETSPARQELAKLGPAAVPALSRELKRTGAFLQSQRTRYLQRSRVWVHLGDLLPHRFGIPRPEIDQDVETWAPARLFWASALLVSLAPDPALGLAHLNAATASLPPGMDLEASSGFRALRDTNGVLSAALTQHLRAGPKARRPFWVSCLGNLGPQPATEIDLVRALARDPEPNLRGEAIKALGSIDTREDACAYLVACATDPVGRQAVMIALKRLGPRALPAEALIRETLKDPDMLTSLFAKFALEGLLPATNTTPHP
ncbi:MAG: HEAT repeat domain-containing protein [Verrucomicrobiales bacterium]|nr:HEAT repeat domain-containing protein [Verrucomicrobiales bacterium]